MFNVYYDYDCPVFNNSIEIILSDRGLKVFNLMGKFAKYLIVFLGRIE